MTGAWAPSGGARRLPSEGSGGAESGTDALPGTEASPPARLATCRSSVSSLTASALRAKLSIADLADVDGAVGEVHRRQRQRDVAARGDQRRPHVALEGESGADARLHARGEGVVGHLRRASMERRIGEFLDQELLQPRVELDLVLRRDAGDVGRPALGGGAGDLVGVLRPVGFDQLGPEDDDLLVRHGEGIHALVEAP